MPKAPRKKQIGQDPQRTSQLPSKSGRAKDPKASHLYTDDNPATTIHGTGFKNREAAQRTLSLISRRSLTYQFQTVNTMWHRANHHPHKTADMKEAMADFRTWLDETYPKSKNNLRAGGFKPVLSKECVKKFLNRIQRCNGQIIDEDARAFAEKYVSLSKGKRLGNVLMDNDKPEEADMERKRYDVLCEFVPVGREDVRSWTEEELWSSDREKLVTDTHLRLIAWAWSPAGERKLS